MKVEMIVCLVLLLVEGHSATEDNNSVSTRATPELDRTTLDFNEVRDSVPADDNDGINRRKDDKPTSKPKVEATSSSSYEIPVRNLFTNIVTWAERLRDTITGLTTPEPAKSSSKTRKTNRVGTVQQDDSASSHVPEESEYVVVSEERTKQRRPVALNIGIPNIFQLQLGHTPEGKRRLAISAPFFQMKLSRPTKDQYTTEE